MKIVKKKKKRFISSLISFMIFVSSNTFPTSGDRSNNRPESCGMLFGTGSLVTADSVIIE